MISKSIGEYQKKEIPRMGRSVLPELVVKSIKRLGEGGTQTFDVLILAVHSSRVKGIYKIFPKEFAIF
jgi:hypothetical protein